MVDVPLYEDDGVVLDETGLTLRRYYFPLATSKRIPYADIRGIDVRDMSRLTGQWRLWGTSNPRYWLPLDLHRPGKRTLVVLDLGRSVQPAFSPDDPDRFLALLRERIDR